MSALRCLRTHLPIAIRWIDDVSVGGETMCDLRRVKVSVFRTDESMDQAVILVTIVRLDL